MEVAPTDAPRLRAIEPAVVLASEQHLEAFGETRLPRAVTTDDERQAGAWAKGQRGGRADAAEAFDGRNRSDAGARAIFLQQRNESARDQKDVVLKQYSPLYVKILQAFPLQQANP